MLGAEAEGARTVRDLIRQGVTAMFLQGRLQQILTDDGASLLIASSWTFRSSRSPMRRPMSACPSIM